MTYSGTQQPECRLGVPWRSGLAQAPCRSVLTLRQCQEQALLLDSPVPSHGASPPPAVEGVKLLWRI